jgi:hypothetical protein
MSAYSLSKLELQVRHIATCSQIFFQEREQYLTLKSLFFFEQVLIPSGFGERLSVEQENYLQEECLVRDECDTYASKREAEIEHIISALHGIPATRAQIGNCHREVTLLKSSIKMYCWQFVIGLESHLKQILFKFYMQLEWYPCDATSKHLVEDLFRRQLMHFSAIAIAEGRIANTPDEDPEKRFSASFHSFHYYVMSVCAKEASRRTKEFTKHSLYEEEERQEIIKAERNAQKALSKKLTNLLAECIKQDKLTQRRRRDEERRTAYQAKQTQSDKQRQQVEEQRPSIQSSQDKPPAQGTTEDHARENGCVQLTLTKDGIDVQCFLSKDFYARYAVELAIPDFGFTLYRLLTNPINTSGVPLCFRCEERPGTLGCGNTGSPVCTGCLCWDCFHKLFLSDKRCIFCRTDYVPLGQRSKISAA